MNVGTLKVAAGALLVAVLVMGVPSKLEAVPFTISSTLTGDIRPENPDNLVVNVTVTGDTASNLTSWVVDLDSPAHPNVYLGAFFFNLAVNPALLSFSNFSPTAWSIAVDRNNANGSGGARFQFEAQDPPQSSNNVTNSVKLSFTGRLSTGFWTTAMFTTAPLSDGDAIANPGAQLGAHLRSLSTAGCSTCNTDSGFAAGNWSGQTTSVPEPTSLILMGLGMAGIVTVRRRSKR